MKKILYFILTLFCFNVASLCAQDRGEQNILVLKLKDGDVEIALRPDLAPKHVERIKKLAQEGSYDGVAFHRVIEDFMAQTGDVQFGKKKSDQYNANLVGTGGSHYPNLPAEFSDESFSRGVVGMARSSDINSANSQFFICFKDAFFLNKQYTIVGKVIKGMEIVDKIKKGDIAKNGQVDDPDIIIKASVK